MSNSIEDLDTSKGRVKTAKNNAKLTLKGIVPQDTITSLSSLLRTSSQRDISESALISDWGIPDTKKSNRHIEAIKNSITEVTDTLEANNLLNSYDKTILDNITSNLDVMDTLLKDYPNLQKVLGKCTGFYSLTSGIKTILEHNKYLVDTGRLQASECETDLKALEEFNALKTKAANDSNDITMQRLDRIYRHYESNVAKLSPYVAANVELARRMSKISAKWKVNEPVIPKLPYMNYNQHVELLSAANSNPAHSKYEKTKTSQRLLEDLIVQCQSLNPATQIKYKLDAQNTLRTIRDKVKERNSGSNELSMFPLLQPGKLNCAVSKADAVESQQIIDKINKDWDSRQHGGMKPKVLGVYKLSELSVEEDFQKLKADRGGTSGLYYHGTGSYATTQILGKSGQFKIVKAKVGRMLGDGIYLAKKSSKSAQYISDSGFTRNHGTKGSLMICEAAFGKVVNHQRFGGDTIVADPVKDPSTWGRLKNWECCVRDAKAVIPRYLVHMELD